MTTITDTAGSNDNYIKLVKGTLIVLGYAVLFVTGLLITYYTAYVITDLWAMFIMPYGASALPIRMALGTLLIFHLFTVSLSISITSNAPKDKEVKGGTLSRGLAMQITLLVVVTLGWLVAMFWNWWLA